jgi:hypothetical protein
MALDFKLKDVLHRIVVKFTQAYLPNAHKPFNLRAVLQQELSIHDIASKAEVYNIETSPKVIEEGMLAGMELIFYLAADGFKIKTPLFNLKVGIPGQYDGTETALPDGIKPQPLLTPTTDFRQFINNNVLVTFDGVDEVSAFISEVIDLHTGSINEALSVGGVVEVRGIGLKVASEPARSVQSGIYFVSDSDNSVRIKSNLIIVNEPRTIKANIPDTLASGGKYFIEIVTQLSSRGSGHILKELRTVRSEVSYIAQ